MSWKSKKHSVTFRSSAEAEYRVIANGTTDVLYLKHLLKELEEEEAGLEAADMWCDNQSVIHIAINPVFYEQTEHIEIHIHFVRDEYQKGVITFHL